MKGVPASEVKNRFGQYQQQAMVAPVVILKASNPASVLMSYAEYERLTAIEDAYWAARAAAAEAEGYLGVEESTRFIQAAANVKA